MPETRNIQVQATLANPEGRLRPGMFVQAEVVDGRRPLGDRAARDGYQLLRHTVTRCSSSTN